MKFRIENTKREQIFCSLLIRVLFFRWSDYLIIDGNKQNNILILLQCPFVLFLYGYRQILFNEISFYLINKLNREFEAGSLVKKDIFIMCRIILLKNQNAGWVVRKE